jgi:hypothetical protein
MIGYRFEPYGRDGLAEHAEAGRLELTRDGAAGGVVGGAGVAGGHRCRSVRTAALASLLAREGIGMPAGLATAVYDAVATAVESLEAEDRVGPDLAYLLGAILKGSACSWPSDRPIVRLLRAAYPDPAHPVWRHVEIEAGDA